MMKAIKKAISVILVVVIMLTAAPLSGFIGLKLPEWLDFSIDASAEGTATSGTCGENLTWQFDESTGTLTISGIGAMYDYDYDYGTAYRPWEIYIDEIENVVIENGVTSIGNEAFIHCYNLKNVILPDGLTEIGYASFFSCYNLTDVRLPDSVTLIDSEAFRYTGIESVFIPKNVEYIYSWSFGDCENLKNITVDGNNQYYSNDEYGVLFDKDKTNLIKYPEAHTRNSYIIPDGVKTIGNRAFSDCKNLTSVIISDSVTTIGYMAFWLCNNLTTVTMGKGVTTIESNAFCSCSKLINITIPDSVKTIGESAFEHCIGLTSITIPDSIEIIGDEAFAYCDRLTNITIPDSVTTIGTKAFAWCDNLERITVDNNNKYYSSDNNGILYNKDKTKIVQYLQGKDDTSYTISDSVTTIGAYAFVGCSKLKNISIPNSVTTIRDYAFSSCSGITSITIGKGVKIIGDRAFGWCNNLENIIVDSSNKYYSSDENGVLFNKDKTTLVQYPIGNTKINYTLPNSVTTIGDYAFSGCDNLIRVTIPDSVTTIGDYVFESCFNLAIVTIGKGVKTIGNYAFDYGNPYWHVLYAGTEEEWNSISIGSSNYYLYDTIRHYNAVGDEITVTDYQESTCDNEGYITYHCSICKEDFMKEVYSKGHTGGTFVKTVAPTCENSGYDVYENCSRCGETYYTNWTYLDHTGGTFVETIAPTCTSAGYDVYENCANCGGIYHTNWTYLEHTGGTFVETIAPTCTSAGYDVYENCSRCGKTYNTNKVPYLGHTGGTFAETIPPTCNSEGYDKYINCSNCGKEYYTNVTPPLWHEGGTFVETIAPTCENDGYDMYENCANCGETYHTNWVPSLGGHTGGTFVETIAPTCTSDGYDIYESCSRCGETYHTNWTSPKEHDFKALGSYEPTCVERGFRKAVCIACGYINIEFNKKANGHNFVNDTCETCGILKEDFIESKHDYRDNCDETWTISKPGAKRIAITFSVETYVEQEYDEINIYDANDNLVSRFTGNELAGRRIMVNSDTVKIQLTSDGSVTYYGFAVTKVETFDEECKHENTEILNKYEPTCDSYGYTGDVYCIECNIIIEYGQELPRLLHNFVNDVCTECGVAAWEYTINDDDTVTILGYHGNDKDVIIPDSIKGYPVTEIDRYAFYFCENVQSVVIGEGISNIYDCSFLCCYNLECITVNGNNKYYSNDEYGVLFNKDKTTLIQYPTGNARISYTIPDSVTTIGGHAFSECDSLTSITISDNVTSIGDYAFDGCDFLADVTIGDGVTIIGDGAFGSCDSLTSITIPNGVKTIGTWAFGYCVGLTSVTIGDGVTTIGYEAFYGCTSLTSVTIPDSVTTIDDKAFYGCKELTSVTIGNNVTKIGSAAFMWCENLTTVTMPDSITVIDEYAFYNSDNITDVYYLGTEEDWDKISIGEYNESLLKAKIHFTNDTTANPSGSCGENLTWEFDESTGTLTISGTGAMYDFEKEEAPWQNYEEQLNAVVINDGVTTIGDYAFHSYDNLVSIIIPDSVTTIGFGAVSYCKKLASVTIGNGMKTIGNSAFGNCPSLTDVYYNGTKEEWNKIDFGKGNESLLNANSHFTDPCNGEHDWSEWKVTKAPTYSEDGEEERFCKTCGVVEARQISKLMYSLNGDVNGDGKVTAVDARILVQHIVGKRALYDDELARADVNGDGNITIVDVRAIAQYVAGIKTDFDTTPGGTPTKTPNIELNTSSDVIKEDDTITVAVTVVENPGIGIMHAELIYDTTTFKVNNVKMNYPSTLNLSDYFISDGKIIYAGVNSWDLYDTGVLFTVELVALQTVDSEITFNIVDAYDNDYDKIEAITQKLKISRERDATFCGDNLTWEFDESTGTLTISGTGDMYDFGSINAPWYEFRDQIKSVVINEGATSVGAWAFNYCDNLVNVSLPDSLTEIGAHSFEGCYDLAKIKIPDSVTTIGAEAFYICSSLRSVSISENVSSIGDGAFSCCEKLEYITVDKDNEYYMSEDYVLFNKDKTVLIQYPSGNKRETYSIPDSVLTVESYAFSNCSYLKTLEIPHSVTKLKGSALYSCDSLEYIWVDEKNENYSSDDNGVLFNKDKTLLIQYPIGNPRNSYMIPDTVVTVGNSAFHDANKLTDVVIAESVVEIKSSAFEECDGLEKVVIPDGVTTIGYEAFASCYNVASVSISVSVEVIDDRAFYNCRSLDKIIVDENNQNYSSNDDGVLFNKDQTVLIQYPIGNTRTSYTIPESVTRIQNDAFIFSDYLVDVTIPEGVTSIGYDAFAYCHSIERFIVDKNNKHYSNDEFGALFDKNKTTLIQYPIGNSRTEYKIPESVTMVNTFALSGSDHLTTLYISKNLSVVRPFAMTSMYYLRDVYYSGTEEDWKQISIDYTNYSLLNANIHFGYCEHLDMDNDGYCDNCDLQLCDHNCHKGGITGFFWMITNFFNKLFGLKQYCDCGVAHY